MTEIAVPIPPLVSAPARRRRADIDFVRGFFMFVMVIYHNFRILWSPHDAPQLFMIGVTELLTGLFMVISGVNVINFIEGARRDPNFDAKKFYIKSSFWLFVMGYSYNMIVGTFGVMDLIQCVAVGSFVAFILLHYRVNNALVGLITLAFFAVGAIAFSSTIELAPSVTKDFLWNQVIGNGAVVREGVTRLRPMSYLFNHYGPIPWVGYFTLGVFLDRLKGRAIWAAVAGSFLFAAAGIFLPYLDADGNLAQSFRTNPRYIVQSIGINSMLFLAGKAWFWNKEHCNRTVAFWSQASLTIFVFHWLFIFIAQFIVSVIGSMTEFPLFHDWFRYPRAILTLAGIWIALGPIERLRVKWSRSPHFEKRARIIMIAGFALAFIGYMGAAKAGVKAAPKAAVGYIGCMMAAYSFVFLYAHLRAKWRREGSKT